MKQKISLNGFWKFAPTHDQKPTNNHNVIESKIPLYAHPKLNRSDWEDVPVPGVWQKYAEKYSIYEGVCWFGREFDLPEYEPNAFVNLTFQGVNYRAEIYINGKPAGVHESAYTAFSLDVSDLVKPGKNTIAVQVDNRPIIVKWPNDWGYGVYGGIHRDVFLEIFEGCYLKNLELTPDFDVEKGKGLLHIRGDVCGGAEFIKVAINGSDYQIACADNMADETISFDAEPWTTEHPKLYEVSVFVGAEVFETYRLGFRNIRCENQQILLNGEPLSVKGACYVYDSPIYGLVMDKTQLQEDLQKMKEANINAIRTHYPMSDEFYALCDEMGFTVWIEPNVYCSKPQENEKNTVFAQPDFVSVARSMTEEMISGARQYASVIVYGIGNECNVNHPEALPFFTLLSQTVRKMDDTRLVGYASLYGQVGTIGHLVDVMGINSYFGWYGTISDFEIEDKRPIENGQVVKREADVSGLHDLIEQTKAQLPKGVPILLTEFGADSVERYHSSACELWSENYHAEVVRKYIEASREHSCVCGTYVFAFTDYLDPSKPKNGRWNDKNLKGMLTYNREYKLPFYALQKAYCAKKTE